ncbi:MAG: hypothetical protein AAF915_23605 [Cyanobacteria bacterium P01_D01_bin.50]
MSNIFKPVWNGTKYYFSDERAYKQSVSIIPYLGEFKSDFDETHSKKLANLLEKYAPELLSRMYGVVLAAAKQLKEEQEKLEKLKEKKIQLEENVARNEELYRQEVETIDKKPGSQFFILEIFLTFGLSILLFIGIYNVFGLVPQQASKLKNLPQTILSLAGAICINLAEKNSIERHVEYYNEVKNEIEKNGNYKRHYVSRFIAGEEPIWLATFIVLAEVAFVTTGLFTLVDDDFFTRLAAVFGASLAAIINVSQSWGLAIKKSKWKRDCLGKLHEKYDKKSKIKSDAAADRAKLKETKRQIKNAEMEIKIYQKRAIIEYKRWEKDLKRFMKVNKFELEI